MSTEPARLAGFAGQKGRLTSGFDADIVIWDPDEKFVVVEELIQHRHKLTPYTGMELFGKIGATYVGGQKVFDNGTFSGLPFGKLLT